MTYSPLRKVVDIDESGYHMKFKLECWHSSLMRPYKFKDHKPYPKRRRCEGCQWHKHDWECWWTEDVDVCRICEREQRCRHKTRAKAEKEGWFD